MAEKTISVNEAFLLANATGYLGAFSALAHKGEGLTPEEVKEIGDDMEGLLDAYWDNTDWDKSSVS